MEDRKEKNAPWLSVPQFGDWDQKGVMPDYSMDFTKIREMRKQNKRDPSRASLGNEEEIVSSSNTNSNGAQTDHQEYNPDHSPTNITHAICYKIEGAAKSCIWDTCDWSTCTGDRLGCNC